MLGNWHRLQGQKCRERCGRALQNVVPAENDLLTRLQSEAKELISCAQLAFGPLFQPDSSVSTEATEIVKMCDEIDELGNKEMSASDKEDELDLSGVPPNPRAKKGKGKDKDKGAGKGTDQ